MQMKSSYFQNSDSSFDSLYHLHVRVHRSQMNINLFQIFTEKITFNVIPGTVYRQMNIVTVEKIARMALTKL